MKSETARSVVTKWPDRLDGFVKNLSAIFAAEKVQVVAKESHGLVIRKLLERHGPAGCPHQTGRPEFVVEALDLFRGIRIGICFLRKRPHVRYFDKDLWITLQPQQ